MLTGFSEELGCDNGILALRHLQKLCVPQDKQAQQDAQSSFSSFGLRPNETIHKYYVRFTNMIMSLTSTGVDISQCDIIDQFLRGLKHISNPYALISVSKYVEQRKNEEFLLLSEVAQELQRIEEEDQVIFNDPTNPNTFS